MLIIITTSCTNLQNWKSRFKKGFLYDSTWKQWWGCCLSSLVASSNCSRHRYRRHASKKREKGTRHLIMSTKTKCRPLIRFIPSILSRLKGNLLISAVKLPFCRSDGIGLMVETVTNRKQTNEHKHPNIHVHELAPRQYTKSRGPKANAQLWKLCANSLVLIWNEITFYECCIICFCVS